MVSVVIDVHYGTIEKKNHSSTNFKVIVIVIWQKINFRPLFGTQSAKVIVVFWHDNEVQIGPKVIQEVIYVPKVINDYCNDPH